MRQIFRPKILDTLKEYSWSKLGKDAMAGVIIGIVALPLAIAFAIASGVSPERGLITAVIAGFLISALGGSRVQIGGPTGAFIVIVYGIVQEFGVQGLIIATFIAGLMLVLMGIARLGSVIKYIPHSLIIGFTSGIAVIIFSSQIKDFLGLGMGEVPADFIAKWTGYFSHFYTVNWTAAGIAVATILWVGLSPRFSKKIPGSLGAILLTTLAVHVFDLPVETIGSRFGTISSSIPAPAVPKFDFATFQKLIQPAFTIAMLGAIESLLSAVVADGMTGGNHRSNTELIGQGVANMGSAIFGGIPATGAIARTATNIKNGGRTPIAGIVHAIVLLLILVFLGQWASLIPLSCLAGILIVIAYNMSEYRNFISILKGPKGDVAVMLTTFFLTVLVDLTIAIEIGIVLAAFSFIRKMIKTSRVKIFKEEDDIEDREYKELVLPKDVKMFDITGPLFFGASYKIREAMRFIKKHPKVFLVRLKNVPVIDASGVDSFLRFIRELHEGGTKIFLVEVESSQVRRELSKTEVDKLTVNGTTWLPLSKALEQASAIVREEQKVRE